MKVAAAPDVHLTYCTNIHAGESWPDLRAMLLDRVAVSHASDVVGNCAGLVFARP